MTQEYPSSEPAPSQWSEAADAARDAADRVVGCLLQFPAMIGRLPEFGLTVESFEPELASLVRVLTDLHEEGEFAAIENQRDSLAVVLGRWKLRGSTRGERTKRLAELWEGACDPNFLPRLAKDLRSFREQVAADSAIESIARMRGPNLDRGALIAKLREAADQIEAGGVKVAKHDDAYRFEPIPFAELLKSSIRLEPLVMGALVARQPCVLGGPHKALKTGVACLLALCMATATPWLGFHIPRKLVVAMISGESGDAVIRETLLRQCTALGIDPADVGNLHVGFRLPQLAQPDDLAELVRGLKKLQAEVVIIDPLYLSLLAGTDANASNVYEMGPLLLRVARACIEAGVTPILLHHFSTGAALRNGHDVPPDISDLAHAGIKEFGRQFILLKRREPYDAGRPGSHRLWLQVSGSAGHSCLLHLDIEEGEAKEDFSGGRYWDAKAVRASEGMRNAKEEAARAKVAEKQRALNADVATLLNALDSLAAKAGGARAWIAERDIFHGTTLSQRRFDAARVLAVADGVIEQSGVPSTKSNGPRTIAAIRRKED